MSTSTDPIDNQINTPNDVIQKGRAVLSTVREDMPVVREAMSELRSSPQSALSKLVQVCKDVWQKVVEVGLLAAIADSVKGLIASITSAVAPRSMQAHHVSRESETLIAPSDSQTAPLLG